MTTAVFPGRYESLHPIREFVVRAAKQAGFNEAGVYAVELAVDEACSNIIEHAYGGEGKGDIRCSYRIDEDALTIVIQDHGKRFDPDAVPEPNFSAQLENLKAGGAGLFLMRKMMDEVHFKFNDHGNTLTMVKYRPDSAAGERGK
jgi:serine/threonine-protein kinase RsbW